MKKVLIIGGKGTACVIADNIKHANSLGYNDYEFAGFVNDFEDEIDGHKVLGRFSDVNELIDKGYYFINTVYKITGQDERIKIFENLNIPDERLCTFVHPNAYVSPSVKLSPGCVVLANASISSSTKLGKCCLVMSNVTIGHDNIIGNYNYFTANTSIGSYITTGYGCWFGLNCTVRGKLNLGNKVTIGIGSVVTKNISDNEIWVGNPARFHKYNTDEINL